ncbi:MAG: hypothetical protein COB62_01660 [Piscirickettsiaceae bacterium]|nr:MAG: hypothetical protein COB62_01660 [Piscirickettsiaceae bacterium]
MSTHVSNIISFNEPLKKFVFEQIHLDITRNATDDFNLFHDKKKWHNITNNPFNGPIMLGFQLEALVEDQVKKIRSKENISPNKLAYSNYQFNFAGAIKPGEPFELTVKKTRQDTNNISNRICIKSKKRLVISGLKKDTSKPLYLATADFSTLKDFSSFEDKSLVLEGRYFLKKKYITTSNAKNYLTGSLVEQSDYIDEIDDKVNFPEMFPCSFISCALLEKARLEGLDFSKNPSVYTQHKISINKKLIGNIKSNDPLYILIQNEPFKKTTDLNCFGLNQANEIIFRSIISLSEI